MRHPAQTREVWEYYSITEGYTNLNNYMMHSFLESQLGGRNRWSRMIFRVLDVHESLKYCHTQGLLSCSPSVVKFDLSEISLGTVGGLLLTEDFFFSFLYIPTSLLRKGEKRPVMPDNDEGLSGSYLFVRLR